MLRRRRRLAALTLPLVVAACGGDGPSGPPLQEPVGTVTIAPGMAEIELGDSVQLEATVLAVDGQPLNGRNVIWTSSDSEILRVGAGGMAVGLAAGAATVTATVEGRSANSSLTVLPWNVAANVLVVDSARLRLVSDDTEREAGRLRFRRGQDPQEVQTGLIVVGAQWPGFLGRVTGVTSIGDELVVDTERASLADAVEHGSFGTTTNLLFAPGTGSVPPGAVLARLGPGDVVWGEGRFTHLAPGMTAVASGFDLSGVEICKLLKDSGSGASCPSQLKKFEIKTGRIDFSPDLELEANFEGFSLKDFRGVAKGTLSMDVLLATEVEGSLGKFEAKPKFLEFTRPFFAQIGAVPVVGYVELRLEGKLTAEATAKAAMEAGYEASASVEIGATWDGSWEEVAEDDGNFTPREPSVEDGTLSGSIEVKAEVSMKPRIQIIFYGLVGPFAQVEPFGKANLSFGSQSCSLSGETGINAALGFTIPFLDDDVQDFDKDWSPLVTGPSPSWTCPLGHLDVATITNGQNTDDDGYYVLVDDKTKGAVASNGRLVVPSVEVGEREVRLEDVASNCIVQGGASQKVTVQTGETQAVSFTIDCTGLTGDLEVITRTSGTNPDTDGYTLDIDGAVRSIGSDETLRIEGIAEGLHTVTLSDVASNCNVQGGSSRLVQVSGGATLTVEFDIQCSATELVVRTVTTGPPGRVTGWQVLLDGAEVQSISPNGQATFSTTPGTHSVLLTGLPDNCTASGDNPKTVDLTGSGAEVTFNVGCESGGLTVNVSTEGEPDGATTYTVRAAGETRSVGVNGSVAFTDLPQGTVSVGLEGVPDNCTVQGQNPRDASVPGSADFEVVCQQPAQCVEPPAPAGFVTNILITPPPAGFDAGGAKTTEIRQLQYGHLEVYASTTAPAGENPRADALLVYAEWNDHIQLVPIDPNRVGEEVRLRINTYAFAEGSMGSPLESQYGAYANGLGWPIFGPSDYHGAELTGSDNGGTSTTNQNTINVRATLGSWLPFSAVTRVSVSSDEGTATARAIFRVDGLVEVLDSGGEVVPIAQVCSASGTDYR